jgi:hypothetical protein
MHKLNKIQVLKSFISVIAIFLFNLPTFAALNIDYSNLLVVPEFFEEEKKPPNEKIQIAQSEDDIFETESLDGAPDFNDLDITGGGSDDGTFSPLSVSSPNRAICNDGVSKCVNTSLGSPSCATGELKLCTTNNNDSEPICFNTSTKKITFSRCGTVNANDLPLCRDGVTTCSNGATFKCDDLNDMKLCTTNNNGSEPICFNLQAKRFRSGDCPVSSSSSSSSSGTTACNQICPAGKCSRPQSDSDCIYGGNCNGNYYCCPLGPYSSTSYNRNCQEVSVKNHDTFPSPITETQSVWDRCYNKAYILAGVSVYEYNPKLSNNRLSLKLNELPLRRGGSCVALEPSSNKIYIIGGLISNNHIIEYDTQTNSVTPKIQTLPDGTRWGASAVIDPRPDKKKIYIFGGRGNYNFFDQILEYDLLTNQVTPKSAKLPSARWGTSSVWDPIGNVVYIFGGLGVGSSNLNEILEYNPDTDVISPPKQARLTTGRYSTSAIWNTASNTAYIFGGHSGLYPDLTYYNEILEYNPVDDTINPLSKNLPSVRSKTSSIWDLTGNRAYVFAGTTTNNSLLNEIVEVDPCASSTLSSSSGGANNIQITVKTFNSLYGLINCDGSANYVPSCSQIAVPNMQYVAYANPESSKGATFSHWELSKGTNTCNLSNPNALFTYVTPQNLNQDCELIAHFKATNTRIDSVTINPNPVVTNRQFYTKATLSLPGAQGKCKLILNGSWVSDNLVQSCELTLQPNQFSTYYLTPGDGKYLEWQFFPTGSDSYSSAKSVSFSVVAPSTTSSSSSSGSGGLRCNTNSDCPRGTCPNGTTYQKYNCTNGSCILINYFTDPCRTISSSSSSSSSGGNCPQCLPPGSKCPTICTFAIINCNGVTYNDSCDYQKRKCGCVSSSSSGGVDPNRYSFCSNNRVLCTDNSTVFCTDETYETTCLAGFPPGEPDCCKNLGPSLDCKPELLSCPRRSGSGSSSGSLSSTSSGACRCGPGKIEIQCPSNFTKVCPAPGREPICNPPPGSFAPSFVACKPTSSSSSSSGSCRCPSGHTEIQCPTNWTRICPNGEPWCNPPPGIGAPSFRACRATSSSSSSSSSSSGGIIPFCSSGQVACPSGYKPRCGAGQPVCAYTFGGQKPFCKLGDYQYVESVTCVPGKPPPCNLQCPLNQELKIQGQQGPNCSFIGNCNTSGFSFSYFCCPLAH